MLTEFYHAAKGSEWTESTYWILPQTDHCPWHGVYCNPNGFVTELILPNNGLSGKLNSQISKLRSLEKLDLSDNEMKVGPDFY